MLQKLQVYFNMSPAAKRSLFPPTSARKRARTTKTIVVHARGESKYKDLFVSLAAGSSGFSIPASIIQSDGQGQRIGSKLRILAIEVRYDLTRTALRDNGAVIRLVIPKDPSVAPPALTTERAHDPTEVVVLHEQYLVPGANMSGMLRWSGPLNVAYSGDTTTCLKNNVYCQVESSSGATETSVGQVRTWYTDV